LGEGCSGCKSCKRCKGLTEVNYFNVCNLFQPGAYPFTASGNFNISCGSGIFLGLVFCILQQRFGLVKMGTDKSIIDAYPIALLLRDFILVFLTVGVISVIASGISARLSIKGLNDIKQDL